MFNISWGSLAIPPVPCRQGIQSAYAMLSFKGYTHMLSPRPDMICLYFFPFSRSFLKKSTEEQLHFCFVCLFLAPLLWHLSWPMNLRKAQLSNFTHFCLGKSLFGMVCFVKKGTCPSLGEGILPWVPICTRAEHARLGEPSNSYKLEAVISKGLYD